MDNRTDFEPLTVCVTVLAQMFLYLKSKNVDIDEFLTSIGVDPESVKAPDSRISIEKYLYIQESAADYTQDECFGLHMGEYFEAGSWSILGYLMMNCATLGEALEKSGRYSRIIGNLITATAHPGINKIKFVFHTPPSAPKMSRHCFEATFSSLIRMVRNLTGKPINASEITFIYPLPENISEYQRVFCCPVLFAQKQNSITVEMALGKTPVLMANPELLAYFESFAQEFMTNINRQNETTRNATRIILDHLDDETLTIQKVAREMALSVRTLQKRLEDEGVIFSDLLKEIREKLAKKYLREDYTVEQITYLLGFSEPSVFRKAFKKWSGVTPREFREQVFSTINI